VRCYGYVILRTTKLKSLRKRCYENKILSMLFDPRMNIVTQDPRKKSKAISITGLGGL
jgi:hypothetical protein